jgi:hypothetical protein
MGANQAVVTKITRSHVARYGTSPLKKRSTQMTVEVVVNSKTQSPMQSAESGCWLFHLVSPAQGEGVPCSLRLPKPSSTTSRLLFNSSLAVSGPLPVVSGDA